MKVDVVLVPRLLDFCSVDDKAVVVIDVLRFTTTIVTALSYGAECIVPLEKPEDIFKFSKNYSGDNILKCGERGGIRISGFDKGNSPREHIDDEKSLFKVRGKTLLVTTTNGTQIFASVKNGSIVITAGFVNMSSVVDKLVELKKHCLIVCSGNEGKFSLEDTVCAGMIVGKLQERLSADSLNMGDDAVASAALYDYYSDDLIGMFRQSENGRNLVNIGLEDDFAFCAEIDRFDLVPVLKNGFLVGS